MGAQFEGLEVSEAQEFCERWLPAWTGNDPEGLASFYTEDVFYCDPAIPDGVQGREALTAYFTRLLARFPDWVWTSTEAIPMEGGFLNLWHATIPMEGELTVECDGVCSVQLRDGLIARNMVYFDRSELLAAIAELEVGAE